MAKQWLWTRDQIWLMMLHNLAPITQERASHVSRRVESTVCSVATQDWGQKSFIWQRFQWHVQLAWLDRCFERSVWSHLVLLGWGCVRALIDPCLSGTILAAIQFGPNKRLTSHGTLNSSTMKTHTCKIQHFRPVVWSDGIQVLSGNVLQRNDCKHM